SEFAVAEHGHFSTVGNVRLIEYLASRGQRLGEYRRFSRHRIRHEVEVRFWKRQEFSKGTGMPNDSQNRSCRAMPAEALFTPFTLAAREIDFSNHATSEKIRIV